MKNLKFLFLIVLTGLTLSSCLDLGDDDYIEYRYCMATVSQGGADPVFLMDEGLYLTVENSVVADTFTAGERYFLYYYLADTTNHVAGSYPINLEGYGKTEIVEYQVLEQDSTDQWDNQPIPEFTFAWFSSNYFNVVLSTFLGTATPNTVELVRMMEDESNVSTDTVPKLYFQLRHNVSSSSTVAGSYHYISYDFSDLNAEFPNATKIEVNVTWNSFYYGDQSFSRDFVWDDTLTLFGSDLPAMKVRTP